MRKQAGERLDQGFTLIELLIAIVVVGILTAIAIVGIAGLINRGTKAACSLTQDAIKTAQASHYTNYGIFPANFNDMAGTTPPELELADGVTLNPAGTVITGEGWTLTVSAGGTVSTPMTVTAVGC